MIKCQVFPPLSLIHSESNSAFRWFMCLACQSVDLWPVYPSLVDLFFFSSSHISLLAETHKDREILTKTMTSQWRNENCSLAVTLKQLARTHNCCTTQSFPPQCQTQCEIHFLLSAKANHEIRDILTKKKTKTKRFREVNEPRSSFSHVRVALLNNPLSYWLLVTIALYPLARQSLIKISEEKKTLEILCILYTLSELSQLE